ncbi:hypothetical protein [Streptomyces collinus]|uniref:hypothetical protein n=1 Tax=Streptomyces collinus TaxID=42684 RepID=UPI0037D8C555
MAFTDHPDVFVGSTDDAWTFVILNRRIPGAGRVLTGAGFTARQHQGRTVYLLPPEAAEDAHELAGVAVYGLMAHTLDLVDLAWTTRKPESGPVTPDVSLRITDATVTATTATGQAARVLIENGFTPTGAKGQYTLPHARDERDALGAVVRTEAHLHADGIRVRVDLGIATWQDIPPPPSRPGAAPTPPYTPPGKRRSR